MLYFVKFSKSGKGMVFSTEKIGEKITKTVGTGDNAVTITISKQTPNVKFGFCPTNGKTAELKKILKPGQQVDGFTLSNEPVEIDGTPADNLFWVE
jgi:hypothetical protein